MSISVKRQKTRHSPDMSHGGTDQSQPRVLSEAHHWPDTSDFASRFLHIQDQLSQRLAALEYGDVVAYTYNPLQYAGELHAHYVTKYCTGPRKVLVLGMNPGPWGMGQTGVPFGHVGYARDWLGVEGSVTQPKHCHPKRPVLGLQCTRNEVSGDRLWSLMKELSGTPEVLFQHVFIHNYCPLFFLRDSAKNIPPPELKVKERAGLEAACDEALVATVELLQVQHIVAVGNYTRDQVTKALTRAGVTHVQVSTLMHPSPVNPAANKGWRDIAIKQLTTNNVIHYFRPSET